MTTRKPAQSAADTVWPEVLDVLVWCAVIVVAVLGTEMIAGKIIRERLAKEAGRFLGRVRSGQTATPDAEPPA